MIDRRTLLLGLTATATACVPKVPTTPGRPPARRPEGELRTLTTRSEGRLREAFLWIPATVPRRRAAPMVMAVHGANQDASAMYARNGWAQACADLGWYGLFPNAGPGHGAVDPELLDVPFLAGALSEALGAVGVDEDRLYGVGFSGGARKIYTFAAWESPFAAIAVSGGKAGEPGGGSSPAWSPRTHGSAPLSILHIHGERDPRMPLDRNVGPGVPTIGMWAGLEAWADHLDAVELDEAEIPSAAPPRVYGREWVTPAGHELLGLVDPLLAHRWAEWATPAAVQFFDRVPPAGRATARGLRIIRG